MKCKRCLVQQAMYPNDMCDTCRRDEQEESLSTMDTLVGMTSLLANTVPDTSFDSGSSDSGGDFSGGGGDSGGGGASGDW